jgi:hypothetical protein
MTTEEMITEFNLLKDLYQAPFFDDVDIIGFLNKATIAIVDSYYPKKNQKSESGSVGQSQRSLDGIHTLIKSADVTPNAPDNSLFGATCFFDLPEDYRHFETIQLRWGTTIAQKVTVKSYDEINQVFSDPFATPNNTDNVYIIWHNNKILLCSLTQPTNARLIYCKNPELITEVDSCELPELEHRNVVTTAFRIALNVAEETERAKLLPIVP